MTWQGFSGTRPSPGTTILDGIRQVAPQAQVTYSADASAPTTGADVGVVVVGETPYAEGFGDVGGPEWAYDPRTTAPREEKSLTLQRGRPGRGRPGLRARSPPASCSSSPAARRSSPTSSATIDALVASWLPGTRAPVSRTCCSAGARSPAGCR